MMGLVRRLGSLKLTLAIFLLLGGSVLLAYFNEVRTSPWLVASLSLLAINLLAAIASNPHFRRQKALLVFHLALLAIVILVAIGRLTYLKGRAEVVEGLDFDGRFVEVDAGPLHPWGELQQAQFTNLGMRILYAPGPVRLGTENRVGWEESDGTHQEATIGDHTPLVRNGYRFYANWTKGFALVFAWEVPGQAPVLGTVNLPSYPANALKQAQQWQLPGQAEPLWAMLQFEGDLISAEAGGELQLPKDYQVVVRQGEKRWELLPGPEEPGVALPGGTLRFLGLRTWMGYQVAWDRTMPWLLAAAVVAVLALGCHFWTKFSARSWDTADGPPRQS